MSSSNRTAPRRSLSPQRLVPRVMRGVALAVACALAPVGMAVGVAGMGFGGPIGCGGASHRGAGVTTPAASTVPVSASASASAAASVVAPATSGFPPSWPYPQGAPAPRSSKAMIVTDNALATKVGADVLAAGGNAVDAAVATALALAVAFPTAGNLGGGGFLVARVAGKSYALDFREVAPAAATRDMYLGPDGKPTSDSRDGWKSSGVPGSVAGLWEAWRTLGSKKLSWAELVAPAIKLAGQGLAVDAAFTKAIEIVQPRLARYPASAALFLPGGALPVIGSTWRDPDLAAVLERIADKGPPGFYEGPVAEAIARAMKEGGGLITQKDLKAYRAKWRTPIEFKYRGRTIVGMPPPSSGGTTMAMIAHLLEAYDLHAMGWHSTSQVHLTVEAMRRAFAARNAKLGDPDFVQNPLDELLSDRWAAAQRATIQLDRATATKDLFPAATGGSGNGPHTTHLDVVDDEGNAVAMTTTINVWFGNGITVPGMGFVLNDEMDDFAAVPGTANTFGLVQGEPNAVAPGKRMLSSMSPTLVLGDDGQVDAVLGAAGGSRIITAVFQELSNVVDFGMDASDAARAPRFHQQDSPDLLFVEPHGLPDDVLRALEA
ncbi:MAG TPA: gamma-glutamyltransferase, partial [Polyangiaceae bacterium]|nr:gamma-glutamyltransferase [Polyangiaceae bacterium]